MRCAKTCSLLWCLAAASWLVAAASPVEAGKAKPGNVPPGDEIEVLDPRVNPAGKPAVVLRQVGDQMMCVDIPPTVLVHRYYYSGDRTFQAQLLPGGPTTVVASHPKTGERCYLEVQMPPGAPRVTYTGHAIEYDFGRQGVTIAFPAACQPKVVYRNGVTVPMAAAHVVTSAKSCTVRAVQASGIPQCAADVAAGTKSALGNVAGGAKDVGKQLVAPVQGFLQMTPLGSLFQSDPSAAAKRRRDQGVQQAQQKAAKAEASIPTLR